MSSTEPSNAQAERVDQLASQCVKCALCLPHCPTYELTQDENESPRGRIALFQALAQGKLPLGAKAKSHLDQCLGCRACERVCPAHVEYGKLLTLGRALLKKLPHQGALPKAAFSTKCLNWLVTKPVCQKSLHWLLWVMQKCGLRTLARKLKLPTLLKFNSLDLLLPMVPKPITFLPLYEAFGDKQGRVSLFSGCITSLSDQETLSASIYVLRHLGFEVHIPAQQTCCGAIALHAGEFKKALSLAKQNCESFLPIKSDDVITLATGCSAVLQEYDQNFSSFSNLNDNAMADFSHKIIDIITFVQKTNWRKLNLHPLKKHVLLHTPCTRLNVLQSPNDPAQLLARIPDLTWQPFTSPHCCGAAGTYMLDHPVLADKLAEQLLKELDNNSEVDFIATSNVGCALHLQKRLQSRYPKVTVLHPIVLLARALGF
ncbi:MAG: (Fe-S)-binding protein [Proteobacteria bacterium]|nr:(Fe-S)-binding protein [Pseudomonadota bacterium]